MDEDYGGSFWVRSNGANKDLYIAAYNTDGKATLINLTNGKRYGDGVTYSRSSSKRGVSLEELQKRFRGFTCIAKIWEDL